jgi:hypothetical protein
MTHVDLLDQLLALKIRKGDLYAVALRHCGASSLALPVGRL